MNTWATNSTTFEGVPLSPSPPATHPHTHCQHLDQVHLRIPSLAHHHHYNDIRLFSAWSKVLTSPCDLHGQIRIDPRVPTKPNPPAAPRGLARVNPNLRPGTQTQLLTFATSLLHKVLTTAFAAEIRPRGRLGGRGRGGGLEFHNKINRGSVLLPRAAWGRQYWSAPTEGLPHRAGRRPAPPSSSAQPAGNTEFFAQGSRYSPTPPARPTPSWGSRGPGGCLPKSPKRGPVEGGVGKI